MKRRRAILFGIPALMLLGAAGGGFLWQRAEQRSAIIAAAWPPPPDLRAWPAEFQRRIAAVAARSPAGLAELSRLYHANGFLAEAIRCYTGLEQLQPTEARWLHRHAVILAGYGDAEPALARWRRVAELAPDYLPARLRIGDLLLKQDRRAEAVDVYGEVLKRQTDNPYALLGLARLDFDAGNWEQARTRLERVTAQTNFELGYDLIVTVYEHFGQREQAASVRGRAKASGAFRDPIDPWMDELVEECFDAYRLSLTAGAASRSGDQAAARRLLERAVALAPGDVAVRFQLAGVYVERGAFGEARQHLERCTATAPNFPDAWAHLSALLDRGGDRAGAERALASGLRACPESPGLHLMRARNLRQADRNLEAIEAYRTSIRFRPNEADAHLELATTLFRLERVPEGMRQLHEALAAEPEHPMVLSLLAFSAISGRDEADAQRWLERVRNQPRVPREQSERLLAEFREQFGREFR